MRDKRRYRHLGIQQIPHDDNRTLSTFVKCRG
jgi:hypothetical protein